MGTLTADCPRLDEHCPHKLATSCRLTSMPSCCACADERPHLRLYRVYIDGVGYVQRGTRWQSYCWFCKEFWNNRLAATDPPLEAAQTQIPHIPDQSEFLERWFEFHQGYRTVQQPDGAESRIAVIGEPFQDVSPGFLPRTLDMLRIGRENDASRPENVFRRRRLTSEEERPEEARQTIEDALDDLLEGLSDDDAEAEAPADEEQNPEMLRRNNHDSLYRPLSRTEAQLHRARDRLVRIFGTREDVQREDYESPISTMYNRAEARYRQAEERRASGRTTDTRVENMDSLVPQERREIEEEILWGVLRDSRSSSLDEHQIGNVRSYTPAPLNRTRGETTIPIGNSARNRIPIRDRVSFTDSPETPVISSPRSTSTATSSLRESLDSMNSDIARLHAATSAITGSRFALVRTRPPRPHAPAPTPSLDQPDRPPPLSDEQMIKKIDCQICYSQLANIAVLPCGHMVMCQWCADIAVPVRHGHIPALPSKCPMCRKTVKQRFKIHMGSDDMPVKDSQQESKKKSQRETQRESQPPGSRPMSMRAEIVNAEDDAEMGGETSESSGERVTAL